MKSILLTIFANSASIIFALGAVYLALHGKEGWGWCIFASILTAVSIKFKDK